MAKIVRKKALVVIAVTGIFVQLTYLVVSKYSESDRAPALVPTGENSPKSEIVRSLERHQTMVAKVLAAREQIKEDEKIGRVLPDKLADVVLSVASQVIPLRINQLKRSQEGVPGDENATFNTSQDVFGLYHMDLLDAYLSYVFELRNLNAMATHMKAKVGEQEAELMKLVAAMMVPKAHGEKLRGAWIYGPEFDVEKLPEPPVGSNVELKKYREILVYDWKAPATQEQRKDIAQAAANYYGRLYPEDVIVWAKALVESVSTRKNQRKSPEAQPASLVAGTERPEVDRELIMGSIKALDELNRK